MSTDSSSSSALPSSSSFNLRPPPPPPPSSSPLVDFLSGSFAGATQVLVGQPLDTLKTRAQTASPGQFKNTLDILSQTVRKEGVLALYKGTVSPLVGISAVNSLLFAAYGVCRRLVSPYPDLTIKQVALAGAGAGAINAVLASPVELFKIKMQGQYGRPGDKKLWSTIVDQYKSHGFRHGIMRGYWVTVCREIPAYAGFYAGYETIKRRLEALSPSGPFGPGSTLTFLTSGAFGGICYWLACYPLDVVKSKVQLAQNPPKPGLGYVANELGEIVRVNGVRGLFKGLTPTLLRAVPAAASTFLAYETAKSFLVNSGL